MKTVVKTDDLEETIKRIIKEVIHDEMQQMRAELVPFVSEEEQKEVERIYRKPNTDKAKSRKVAL